MPGRNHALKMHEVRMAGVLYEHGGFSRRQIAQRFGVSDMAVRSALKLAGVTPRTKSEAYALRPGGWPRCEEAA